MPRKPKRNAGLRVHVAKKTKHTLISHPPQEKKAPGRPRKSNKEEKTATTPQYSSNDADDVETPGSEYGDETREIKKHHQF